MAKRILLSGALALFIFLSLFSGADAQNKNLHKAYPVIDITGDELPNPDSKKFTGDIDAVMNLKPYTKTYSDDVITITDVFTGQTSLYDYVSNGVPQHIVQLYKDTIQLVFMRNMTPGIPSSNRRCIYLVSTNTGANWTNLGDVFANFSSGYPCIDQLSGGTAVIGGHAALGSTSSHSVIAIDIAPLIGVFMICDPNYLPGNSIGVWVRMVTTQTGKISFVASINGLTDPNVHSNSLTNTISCTFSGWNPLSDVGNAESYALARSSSGKIGLAYVRKGDIITANIGDVRFIESTDEGLTWGTPVTIYDAQPNSSNFLGGLRGIDLVYAGDVPNVVFDLVWQTDAGSYFPSMCSRVMFWSPEINGGIPAAVADSTNTAWHPVQGINDVYTPICRGSIGRSIYNTVLLCTYCVARAEVSPLPDSTPYFDVYLAWSYDGGDSWSGREKLTNISGPLRDCRYPNLAPVNDIDPYYYYANIEYINDSIPGSAVNGAQESPAQQHFLRVQIPGPEGINSGNNLPLSLSLSQNYPNPFNPVTIIKYSVSKNVFVTLTIYDASGREITKLVNENKNPGSYEVQWNAESYPSGVYFYELRAGDYSVTKKMVLIK